MNKFVLPILTVAALAVTATTAAAGCNPKCATGSTCRYEAAGGKYYCVPNKGFMGSISKQPGAGFNIGMPPSKGFNIGMPPQGTK